MCQLLILIQILTNPENTTYNILGFFKQKVDFRILKVKFTTRISDQSSFLTIYHLTIQFRNSNGQLKGSTLLWYESLLSDN